jgi:hypothetical protein
MNANEEIKEFLKSKGLDFNDDTNEYLFFIKAIISELILDRDGFSFKAKEPIDIVKEINFENKHIKNKDSCGDLRRSATVTINSINGTRMFFLELYEKFINLYDISVLEGKETLIIEIDNKIDFSMFSEKLSHLTFMYNCL